MPRAPSSAQVREARPRSKLNLESAASYRAQTKFALLSTNPQIGEATKTCRAANVRMRAQMSKEGGGVPGDAGETGNATRKGCRFATLGRGTLEQAHFRSNRRRETTPIRAHLPNTILEDSCLPRARSSRASRSPRRGKYNISPLLCAAAK